MDAAKWPPVEVARTVIACKGDYGMLGGAPASLLLAAVNVRPSILLS